jgi:hypothetical protein
MRNRGNSDFSQKGFRQDTEAAFGESSDPDRPRRPERSQKHLKISIAFLKELCPVVFPKLIGGEIPSFSVEKKQRTKVEHETIPEEILRRYETFLHQAPESRSAHLAPFARKA